MRVTQWRVDHTVGVDGWLVIEGLGSQSHQPAIREAYAQGHVIDGPAELIFDDDEYGAAMRYPILRIKGGPGQSTIPRARADGDELRLDPSTGSLTPGDARGRLRG